MNNQNQAHGESSRITHYRYRQLSPRRRISPEPHLLASAHPPSTLSNFSTSSICSCIQVQPHLSNSMRGPHSEANISLSNSLNPSKSLYPISFNHVKSVLQALPMFKICTDAKRELNQVSTNTSEYDPLSPAATASSSQPTLPTRPESQQRFTTPIGAQYLPISSSVLTSIDSSFFEANGIHSTVDQNESSSAYFALQSSPPLVPREPATSPCLSTIPDIRISSDDDSEGTVHIVPVKRTQLATRSFVHFHGSTSGLGLAKRWNCNYCELITLTAIISLELAFHPSVESNLHYTQ